MAKIEEALDENKTCNCDNECDCNGTCECDNCTCDDMTGLENEEIAKVFGIKEETVRQRISRGKKMLEEKLEGMEK